MLTYKDAGVNVSYGDALSKYVYEISKTTWKTRKGILGEIIQPIDGFSGIKYIDVSKLPKNTVMGTNYGGIGTKVELAEQHGCYFDLAHDLIAMVCDDAASYGAEPVLVGSILDIDKIPTSDFSTFGGIGLNALIHGYADAAIKANVAIINGEIAELGSRVNGKSDLLFGPSLNWGASCIWFANKNNLINTSTIKENDYLVGLKEYGFRSNGFTLLRKVLSIVDDNRFQSASLRIIVESMLRPSIIYTPAIVEMTGGFQNEKKVEIHGIAHITGGGLYGKMKRILSKHNLSAYIDNPYSPPDISRYCQIEGKISDKEAYKTWNMGNGMVIITPEPNKVIEIAGKHNNKAQVIGKIIKGQKMYIRNKGAFSKIDFLEFED